MCRLADPLPIGEASARNFGRPRLRGCPVVFSKLSRVLNQEDALGVPCLGCDFCSPQAPARGAGMLRTGVNRRFGVTFTVATPKSSCRHALMVSWWLAAVHG
jgi:hypothetical protein